MIMCTDVNMCVCVCVCALMCMYLLTMSLCVWDAVVWLCAVVSMSLISMTVCLLSTGSSMAMHSQHDIVQNHPSVKLCVLLWRW